MVTVCPGTNAQASIQRAMQHTSKFDHSKWLPRALQQTPRRIFKELWDSTPGNSIHCPSLLGTAGKTGKLVLVTQYFHEIEAMYKYDYREIEAMYKHDYRVTWKKTPRRLFKEHYSTPWNSITPRNDRKQAWILMATPHFLEQKIDEYKNDYSVSWNKRPQVSIQGTSKIDRSSKISTRCGSPKGPSPKTITMCPGTNAQASIQGTTAYLNIRPLLIRTRGT